MNGRRTSIPSPEDIEQLTARVDHIKAEISALERTGLPLEERIARGVAQLEAAQDFFMTHGFDAGGVGPGEVAARRYQATIGALMVTGGNLLIGALEAREKARGEGGLLPEVRDAGIAQLQRDLHRAQAALEQAFRAQEAGGLQPLRGDYAVAELYLSDDAAVARIANGQEATA